MPEARMRAAVVRDRRLRLEEVPRPEPGPGEVRVRVTACGICGSDLHLHRSGLFPPGVTPGHEIAGVVDALGPGVRELGEGETVAVEPFLSCGECPECQAGRDPLCRRARILGVLAPGGLAEYVVVPARRLFHVPADLEPPVAALAEPTAVAVHGLRRVAFEPGQRVLILGAGPIGLLTLLTARALGAEETWITARHEHQAALARDLGAERVLPESEAEPDGLRALGEAHRFDLVVETVGGSAPTLHQAVAAVRPGGAISVLGMFLGKIELDAFPLLLKEVTLAWSYCYRHGDEAADFAEAVDLLDAERERAARIATHPLHLDEVERAFEIAAARRSGVLKVSIMP